MLDFLDVPADLQPSFAFPYPGHQRGPMLEEYVHRYLVAHREKVGWSQAWTYVPIYWTSYAARRRGTKPWHVRGNPSDRRLRSFLARALRDGARYFTVSQHDDGLRQRGRFEPPQPILEFNSGGCGDIPLPLLCDPHPVVERNRDVRASFLGLIDDSPIPYPCRDAMRVALADHPEYLIRHAGNDWGSTDPALLARKTHQFVELMSRSVFALCPRGYGKTSFRMYEAMQLGCIPVYIYDEPWLPYTDVLDWSEFAVLVHLNDAGSLHDILSSKMEADIRRMRQRLREVCPTYFTFEGTARQVVRYIAARSERRDLSDAA
jgi:hypothetical protein